MYAEIMPNNVLYCGFNGLVGVKIFFLTLLTCAICFLGYNGFMKGNIKVWLDNEGAHVLGEGRYILLKTIRDMGSLHKASLSLKYSYRYAWGVIKKMEALLGHTLLISKKGGAHGGESVLTDKATQLLARFEEYQQEMHRLNEEVYMRIFGND